MITLRKPISVEVIHAEFDSSEERILQECDTILSELKIPTETRLEKKAEALVELGFVNAEPVQQARTLKETKSKIQEKLVKTEQVARTIKELKATYPLEKFLTVDELERICKKYNLIHAPAKNYIKDIPEKNVLEMKSCKKLLQEDTLKHETYLEITRFFSDVPQDIRTKLAGKVNISNFDAKDIHMIERGGGDRILNEKFNLNYSGYIYGEAVISTVNKSGLFIAAPPSHFNLDGLDKKSKYGFFEVTKREVKDPVVFEYCRDNMVRIVSKWGSDTDVAYLDPLLTNEVEN